LSVEDEKPPADSGCAGTTDCGSSLMILQSTEVVAVVQEHSPVEGQGRSRAAAMAAIEFVPGVEPAEYSSARIKLWSSAVVPESALPN
jgi:hypothetical protein